MKNVNVEFPKTEKIEVRLRQDLADRLPKEKSEKNEFINEAVEYKLDGIKSAASLMGQAKSEKKAIAARENAKKPRKRHVGGFNSIYCMKDGIPCILRLIRDDKIIEEYNEEIKRTVLKIEHGNLILIICPAGGGQYPAEIQPIPGEIPDIYELAERNGFEIFDMRDFNQTVK